MLFVAACRETLNKIIAVMVAMCGYAYLSQELCYGGRISGTGSTAYYRAVDFLVSLGYDELINDDFILNIKVWDKKYQNWMDIFREWINKNKEEILDKLNTEIFIEDWNKYAKGTISAWEMEVLCFYYHEHELEHINNEKYGFSDFFKLPPEPVVEKEFPRGNRMIKMYKLSKICGTCIAKNKTKSTVTLLTTTGVVNVKFRKEHFTLFDKQISERGPDGVKHVMEKSWFNRGNMIVVQGIRQGDDFITKKYASSGGHQLYKIDLITDNNELVLKTERYKGDME